MRRIVILLAVVMAGALEFDTNLTNLHEFNSRHLTIRPTDPESAGGTPALPGGKCGLLLSACFPMMTSSPAFAKLSANENE
jgi:hypothetical protein